mgnify:FL=1
MADLALAYAVMALVALVSRVDVALRDGEGLQHMAGHVAAAVAWPVWIIWAAVEMSRKGDDDER